ncbi:MAG: hypothetical protein KKD39_00105 [Candidatus Altiarchaeota archaeon]|nr:hypothetical protein [Candidatus Altiarchaeota archaeon]
MHEPTDRELKIQGLTRAEFDSLSSDGKKVIAERSQRLRQIDNTLLGAQLLNTMLDLDEHIAHDARQALEGKNEAFQKRIKDLVIEYLDAGVETSISDYYKIRYGKAGAVESTSSRKDAEELLETKTEPAVKSHEIETPLPEKTTMKPQGAAGRKENIASELATLDGKTPDYIMRTETDVIEKIISIVDELRPTGITDEKVIRAMKDMMKEDGNIHYPMETLLPEKREELIRKAKQ